MKKEYISMVVTFFVCLLCFYLLYRILSPFLESIFWGIVFSLVFFPLYRRLQNILRIRGLLSALIMTLLVTLAIVIPFILLMISLANEVIGAYHSIEEMIRSGSLQSHLNRLLEYPAVNFIWKRLDRSFGLSETQPLEFLLRHLQEISRVLLDHSTKILRGLSTFLFTFFFTLLSVYYFFKDGEQLFSGMKKILPGPFREKNLLIRRFHDMVNATIYGGLLIALIQGILGGLAFWTLGLHSPVLWGMAMALFSFIPIGGTALIWGPTCIILFIEGYVLEGIVLLLIGVFVISMVDNFLRPFFISSRTNIHPLLLFFAVLGGIQTFGLVGLVAGPLIATLCLTLIEIYSQGVDPAETPENL